MPAGFVCSAAICSVSLPDKEFVTLTATPNVGSVFTGFSNNFLGINPETIQIGADITIGAVFGLAPAATVSKAICTQANHVETIQSNGTLHGPLGTAIQVTLQADPFNSNIFVSVGSAVSGFDCGAWARDATTNTCTRLSSQPADSTWSQDSTLTWTTRFPTTFPAGGISVVLLRAGTQNILASQHSDCPVQ
jgi:hypothetical protein